MARPASGAVRWNKTAKVWEVRCTLADGSRSRPIAMTGLAACAVAPTDPPRGCSCDPCKVAHGNGRDVSTRMRAGAHVDVATEKTVSEWFADYYQWREGRDLSPETAKNARGRFAKWCEPRIGTTPMRAVTRAQLEDLVMFLDEAVDDEQIMASSAINIWSLVTCGFDAAANCKNRSLRILETNPAEGIEGPDAGTDKLQPFLRPDEVIALLSCEAIPLARRRCYAVAIYTAARQSELRGLRVRDVDFEAMQITISRQEVNGTEKQRTKTGRARVIQIEPHLVALLEVLVAGKGPDDRLLTVISRGWASNILRADLLRAGCTREALHVPRTDPQRARMRFHSLRHTCGTHMAVRRDPPQDIQWRLGHTTPVVTEAYIASARYQAGATFGEPLPPIPTVVLGDVPRFQPKRAPKYRELFTGYNLQQNGT